MIFNWIFHGCVPVAPLIPYNINFIQHAFIECTAFGERNPALDKGSLHQYLNCYVLAMFLNLYRCQWVTIQILICELA
jgi:hypothetical protein